MRWSPSASSLILYLSKARPTLEEVSADVQRTRGWLEDEQRTHWENELRRRSQALGGGPAGAVQLQALQLREASAAEQMAVHRAKRALDEADAKLRVVKQWNRVFDNRVDPLVKQMEKLHTVLANDMVQAVAYLAQAIDTLRRLCGSARPRPRAAPAEAAQRQANRRSPIANRSAPTEAGRASHEGKRQPAGGHHQGTAGPVAEHEGYWKDAKSQEFERRYMEELLASVDRAVTVIEQLDKLITKIRSDCE